MGLVPDRQAEERVPDHQSRMVVRHMGELQAARHVTDRVDPPVRDRAQALVDLDPLPVVFDPGRVQPHILDIRLAPDRHEQVRAFDGGAIRQCRRDRARLAGELGDLCALANIHALGAQLIEHDGGQFRVILVEGGEGLEHRDLRAQAPVGLGKLDPDRAAADDNQVLGPFAVLPQCLVGHVGHLVEARDRRDHRRRARSDHKAPRLDDMVAGGDLGGPGKACPRLDHLDAQPLKPLDRVMRGDLCDGHLHMGHRRCIVDFWLVSRDAQCARSAVRMRRLARGDQRLRRHAAVVQAVAAHLASFDQHHRGPHLHGARGDRKPAGAGADDAKIGLDSRRHVRRLARSFLTTTGRAARAARPRRGNRT